MWGRTTASSRSRWSDVGRPTGAARLAELAGPEKGVGFRVAATALGSNVVRRGANVYDLPESGLGEFDVVVCGSLLMHLRDPVRALKAIRAVCKGEFMSS